MKSDAIRWVLSVTLLLVASAGVAGEPPTWPTPKPAANLSATAQYQRLLEATVPVRECVEAELVRRGLTLDTAMDVLDATPGAPALRQNLLRLMAQDVALTADDRRRLDTDRRLRVPYVGYQTKGAATLDLGVIARVAAVQAVYLDRALGSRCGARPELLNFIGVTPRAD